MYTDNCLNVLYAADNNYAPYMGISMFSLFENNKDIENITVYTILDRVSEENIKKIQTICTEYGRNLKIIEANALNKILANTGLPQYRGSYANYYRMFFELVINDSIERLLYLDSDTIICGSLSELITIDMEEECAAVVLDAMGNRYKLLIGLKPEDTYFNSGVILFDIHNWKEKKCNENLIDHITNKRAAYISVDQDILSIVLKGKTKVLPPVYNFMPVHMAYSDKAYEKCFGFENYYSREQIEKARENPIVLHTYRFIGEFPWNKGNLHPACPLFDYYMKKSPWNDYSKESASVGMVYKIEKILYKTIPKDLFLMIFSKVLYYTFKHQEKRLKMRS